MAFFDSHASVSSLYLHYPICKHVCSYCDFNVFAKSRLGIPDFNQKWRDQVLKQVESLFGQRPPRLKTLYFGGGTPSLLDPKIISDLLRSLPREPSAEVTLEANPETLSEEKLRQFFESGVNRLSLGVQSFSSAHLRRLERLSTVKAIETSLRAVREIFDNFSIDLMIGTPDQKRDDAIQDLERALEFRPPHLSLYILTIAPDHIWNTHPAMKNRLPPNDDVADTYLAACERLARFGYNHYEVSNFAQPGFESQHNQNYWNPEAGYGGIGPGAHGYRVSPTKVRYEMHRRVEDWLDSSNGINEEEELNSVQQKLERSYLRLRSGTPLSLEDCGRESIVRAFESEGLLQIKDDMVILTERGWLQIENIAERLLVSG